MLTSSREKDIAFKCVFPQTFDILIYCVAEDRAIAFLPMKKKKVTFIVN